ncbi:very short patch repair endonuclease [Microvirga flocculans]|nr:very short patch repair endonuclease [Microvirga flocculans]
MSRVRSKDTAPEMVVRRLVHAMGYRFRLHGGKLPGKPDLVFPGRRKVIFVHGCFWHRHDDPSCKLSRTPKSNLDYWRPKFERNRERDAVNLERLTELGWEALVIWECQTRDREALTRLIHNFLGTNARTASSPGPWRTRQPASATP